jgi:hypothetical protein
MSSCNWADAGQVGGAISVMSSGWPPNWMGSRSATELDPAATEDDGRAICDGVSVAPYEYFAEPTKEEVEAFFRDQDAARVDSAEDDPMPRYRREVEAWIQTHGVTEPGTPEDEAKRRHLEEIKERYRSA